jgi:hypothetical protein
VPSQINRLEPVAAFALMLEVCPVTGRRASSLLMETNKITDVRVKQPGMVALGNPDAFKDRPVKAGPGRPKGSPNKMGHDLMTLVMQAAENVGYLEKNDKGELVATGKGGTLKYLEWCAVHKIERFLALMARVAPKQVFADEEGARRVEPCHIVVD